MLAITDLDNSAVEQAETLLLQFLQEAFPSMDLSRGRVFHDLLIRPAAMFYALNETNLDQIRRSMSLQQIVSEPGLANDDIVDQVLSNLRIVRGVGRPASGQIRVILAARVTTPLDTRVTFSANGVTYAMTSAFTGVTSPASLSTSSSRIITERSDGYYEFIIDVQATTDGPAGNVADGTRFVPSQTITRALDLVAAGDFTGGRVSEDNASLAARAQESIAPQVLSGRVHITSLLRANFDSVRDVSIIGFGDAEMRRDAHNAFGISQGGKVDIYVRTAAYPQRDLREVTATMLDTNSKTLQISLDRDAAAGVYDVLAVYAADATPFELDEEGVPALLDSLELTTQSWTVDLSSTGVFVPDIASVREGAFSRYRRLNIRFVDPDSDLAEGETATYRVYLLSVPDIAAIQDFVNARDRRSPGTDYLVKAALPAVCSIGVRIISRDPAGVDVQAVRNAIVERINALTFQIGFLPSSVIIDAAQSVLTGNNVLDLPITMTARLYLPDGTTRILSTRDELHVPVTTDEIVSSRTVAFSVSPEDVDVSVEANSMPET